MYRKVRRSKWPSSIRRHGKQDEWMYRKVTPGNKLHVQFEMTLCMDHKSMGLAFHYAVLLRIYAGMV